MLKRNSTWRDTFYTVVRFIIDWFCIIYGSLFNLSKKNQIPAIKNPILVCPAITISNKVRAGEWKAVDVISAYLNRIEEVNPFVNAVVEVRHKALEDAQKIDEILKSKGCESEILRKKPLLGVPFTCKDGVGIKGMKLTNGIYNNRDKRATEDALVVIKLQDAGAIPVAITNVPEHTIWWDTNNMVIGRTNNPYDLSKIPGGSSGGEAALIASGGSLFGVSTEVGGSIRLPSFFCGIFGHKTTPEIIATNGIDPPPDKSRKTYYSVGPMCRYASDLLPILQVMIDDNYPLLPSIIKPVDLSTINVFYMEDDFDPMKTPVSDEIKHGLRNAVKYLEDVHKLKCEEHIFPMMKDSLNMWVAVMSSISLKKMDEYLAEGEPIDRINIYWEFIKRIFGCSKHTPSVLFLALNEKMVTNRPDLMRQDLKKLDELKEEFKEKLGENGVFLYPTHPETAPKHGTTILKSSNVGFVSLFNLMKTPVTQCTLGLSSDGMPFGIQVISNEFNDHLTIAIATQLANAFGGWIAPCPVLCSQKY